MILLQLSAMSIDTYWRMLLLHIPGYIYQVLFGILVVGACFFFVFKGKREGLVYTIRLLLIDVLFFVYCSTLIYRKCHGKYQFNYRPFWSYDAINAGNSLLLSENIMNVLAFIPIGMLLGFGYSRIPWWKLIGIGCFFSITIEVMQLITKRGYSETDDVIHNTLGCLIGYSLYIVLKHIYKIFVVTDMK